MRNLTLIVARDKNNGIGKNNELPWPKLTEDLKHFKAMTSGHTVIMGSATLESIGRALPGRRNYVLSTRRNLCTDYEGIYGFYSLSTLVTSIKNESLFHPDNQYFVIGGQNVYDQLLDECDRLLVTEIDAEFDCDRFFDFDKTEFEVASEFFHPQSSQNPVAFTIREYVRKK